MFDHFPNMFGLLKLNSRRAELAKLKNQLFGIKKFSDFQVPTDMKDSDTKWGMVCMVKVS